MTAKANEATVLVRAPMVYQRSTKGTHRFQEVDAGGEPVEQADAKIGTLYVRKSAMAAAPERIVVMVVTG